MDDQEMIDLILNWAALNEDFDVNFVMDLEMKLKRYGHLTKSQSEALENIIDKYELEV